MTTLTFDVSYGTRAVPLRLPYVSVRRHAAMLTPAARGQRSGGSGKSGSRERVLADVMASRERAVDRALTLRAGAGV
jgi:hypothetical protein